VCHSIKIFIWTAPLTNPDFRGKKPALTFGVSYEWKNHIKYFV